MERWTSSKDILTVIFSSIETSDIKGDREYSPISIHSRPDRHATTLEVVSQ